jgi:CRP-like cAMP-binding protein
VLPTAQEVLARAHVYAELPAEVAQRLALICRVFPVAKDKVLFRAGDICPGVFVVHAGLIHLSQSSPAGKSHVLRFVEPGHSFAEAAVLGPFNCPVQAEAGEDSVVLMLPAEALRERLAVDHALSLAMLRGVALNNRNVVRHTEDITLRDASGRLASYLCDQLDEAGAGDNAVHLVVQKQDLARYLNLTSETLSRVLRRLLDEGIIEHTQADELGVLDRPALDALAGREPHRASRA